MPDACVQSALSGAAFEESPTAMVVLDRGGRVTMWNRAAEALFGWSAAEVMGQPPPYIAEGNVEAFLARHEEAFHEAELVPFVVRRRHRDGRSLDLLIARAVLRDAAGEPQAMLGTMTDLTERRREEEEQRRVEANLRMVIERCPDGMVVHRLGQIVFANTRMAELLGYGDRDALMGRPVLAFVFSEERAAAEERVQLTYRGEEAPPRHGRLRKKDGAELQVEISSFAMPFDGQPAVLAVVRDLTERLRFEAELRARDQLATVGQIAAGVAHEMNNPLAYVIINLDLALRQLGTRGAELATTRELVAEAREGVERVRHIVGDLKTFSRRDRDEPGPVDVRRVVESSIAMAHHEIRQRARLERRYEDVRSVHGHESRLGQVFLNLLLNAAQAIAPGRPNDNAIVVSVRPAGERVVVEVRDTGAGVPAEARARLFEPFFTTKGPGNGTGLGLAISRSIVHGLGGTISVTAAEGGGTSVVVELSPSAVSPSVAAPTSATFATARRRVLVVDDEPRVASAIASLLETHEVVVAPTAEEALARLLRDGEVFDAILCDVMLPGTTGIEFHERLRVERPGLERRIVFMTGGAYVPRAATFLASVPNACLEKPFESRQLAEAVERAARAR